MIAYNGPFEDSPEASLPGWLKPFLRPHPVLIAVGLAVLAAGLRSCCGSRRRSSLGGSLTRDLGLLWILMGAIAAVLVPMTAASLVRATSSPSWVAVRFDVATLDFLTSRLFGLPMSYFTTRRTGDIERRLSGARQVRQFFIQSGVQALTSATQLLAAIT